MCCQSLVQELRRNMTGWAENLAMLDIHRAHLPCWNCPSENGVEGSDLRSHHGQGSYYHP